MFDFLLLLEKFTLMMIDHKNILYFQPVFKHFQISSGAADKILGGKNEGTSGKSIKSPGNNHCTKNPISLFQMF